MRPTSRLLLALLLLPIAAPIAAMGQKKFAEKVTVEYVEVPVTVLGRDGGPMRGLTKENFQLLDDGQERSIESFDTIDFAAAGGPTKAISPLNPASRRNFLLLFDLSYSNPLLIARAQDAARGFIARSIGNRDLVSIGTFDVDRGFRFLTAFTTDRNLLAAAIGDPGHFRGTDPLQIASTNPFPTGEATSVLGSAAQGSGPRGEDLTADASRMFTKQDESYRRNRVREEIEMLGAVAKSLRRLAGRKHIVLLSEGFDPKLVLGRSASETAEQFDENLAVETGQVWKVDSDARFGSTEMQTSVSRMAEEFRRSDVMLHAVDIQGVRVQNDVRGGKRLNTNEGLFILADATGGTVLRNSNDIASDFDRLTRQQEVVYVLGFRAPVGRAGQFHELKVRLVDVPGARLKHRGGYYDTGNESGVERVLTTAEIIVNDIPQDDLRVAALAASFPTGGQTSRVPVILEIDGDDLVENSRDHAASTEVFVYAFDENGLVRDAIHQRIALDMTIVGQRLRGSGVRFYGTLNLPPGRYAIKSLVVIDESGKKGYQRVDLVVPAPGDVAVVRPFFFDQPGDWVMVKAARDGTATPYPFVLNGEAFIPAARATLRRGEPRLFTVFVYNADPDELTWEIQPEAKLVSQSKGDDAGADVTKYLFSLDHIPPNTTDLGVTIRKKGSTDARRVDVPLFVE